MYITHDIAMLAEVNSYAVSSLDSARFADLLNR